MLCYLTPSDASNFLNSLLTMHYVNYSKASFLWNQLECNAMSKYTWHEVVKH